MRCSLTPCWVSVRAARLGLTAVVASSGGPSKGTATSASKRTEIYAIADGKGAGRLDAACLHRYGARSTGDTAPASDDASRHPTDQERTGAYRSLTSGERSLDDMENATLKPNANCRTANCAIQRIAAQASHQAWHKSEALQCLSHSRTQGICSACASAPTPRGTPPSICVSPLRNNSLLRPHVRESRGHCGPNQRE